MTRLASIEKAGFYPTPPSVFERIAGHVHPSTHGGRLLDPCCGDGKPAAYLARAWNLEPYGIEIDGKRADESARRLKRVLHSDYAKVRAPHGSFQVLFLNPPYDYDEGKFKRVEYRFLRETTKWLQSGGVLIYLIPQHRLDTRVCKYLATHYKEITVYRFPDPEFASFRQIVLFAVRKGQPLLDGPLAIDLPQSATSELCVLPDSTDERYSLPTPMEKSFYFRGAQVDPQEALEEALTSGAWRTREWRELLEPRSTAHTLRPLMPLKKGHLAMLIAAGLMRNLLLDRDGERLLIKGRTRKVQEEVDSGEENTEIVRDRFLTEITSLDLNTGEVEELDEADKLTGFIDSWKEIIAEQVVSTLRPIYDFDYHQMGNQVKRVLDTLSRYRRLPGRARTGLFEAQKHVTVAIWKRLLESDHAICVGEMGCGKTTVAVSVTALLGDEGYPALVICPPHLVRKWVREIRGIVPVAQAVVLKRVREVDRFVKEAPYYQGRPLFAVISREMAKLGSGWRPAVSSKPVRLDASNDHPGRIARVYTCPHCGESLLDHEGGMIEHEDYFDKKRKCDNCQEPLFQFTRLNDENETGFKEWILDHHRQGGDLWGRSKPPARARYPLSDYIAKRYPGFFKLLIVDEVHQFKGQSTDQGYAMGTLVKACRKTIALTGTIFGGRATSLFYLLYRLSPEVRRRFGWSEAQAWAERYGILERVTKYDDSDDGYGYYTAKRRRRTYVRELPGISPELVTLLLDSTAFLRLADLGFELPDYLEIPRILSMDPEQAKAYQQLRDTLESVVRARLAQGDHSLLGAYLQALLSYPNACFREEEVTDPEGTVVAIAPSLGEERLYPKERWLLELTKKEKQEGRRVLVFCRQTATRDITHRLAEILRKEGLRAAVLSASVGTQTRERWLKRRVRKGIDVLITNPRLIETGLDLVAFQTSVFFEIEYSLYTLMQAARRTWRLGQIYDVKVYYAVYANTMEYRAMTLIAQKLAAALLLYGDAVEGALVQEADTGRGFLADLAKSVIEGAEVPDLNQLFAQQNQERIPEGDGFLTDRPLSLQDRPVEERGREPIKEVDMENYRQMPLL